jgi:integrase
LVFALRGHIGATMTHGGDHVTDVSLRVRTTPRGDSRWQLRYRIDGEPGSRTFTDQRSADRWLALFRALGPAEGLRLLDGAEDGSEATVASPTVAEVVQRHIDSLSGVTDGTRRRYRAEAERDIYTHRIGSLPIGMLTSNTVAAWVNDLAAPMNDEQLAEHRSTCRRCRPATAARPATSCRRLSGRWLGLSGKSIANRHSILSAACSWAVEQQWINRNPCRGVSIPRTLRREPVFLSPVEVYQLTQAVAAVDDRYVDLVTMLVGTGLRWGELTAMTVDHVTIDRSRRQITLRVDQSWKDAGGKLVLGPPKSPRSRRTVVLTMPSPVTDAFLRAAAGRLGGTWLVESPRGCVLRNGDFHHRVWIPAVCTLLHQGWTKRPRIHDLRHTAASWMIAAGEEVHAVSEILGHEKPSTTMNVYGHFRPGARTAALSTLGTALGEALLGAQ